MLLLPLLMLGSWACGDDDEKRNYDVTLVCKNADTEARETLKTVVVRLREGTLVDGDYLRAEGLIPAVDGYDYLSFEGPAGAVARGSSYVLLYSAVKYTLTINYRNVAAADEPLGDPVTVEVQNKTVVDEAWLREGDYIPAFEGQVFRSIDPQTVTMNGDRSVTVIYETQKLGFTIRYRVTGNPNVHVADDVVLDDVEYGTVVNEAWLRKADLIKEIEYYAFSKVEPTSVTATATGEITVWYNAQTISVRFRYEDENGATISTQRDMTLQKGTTVDLDWIRTNASDLIKTIDGYFFKEIRPVSIVVTSGLPIVSIRYSRVRATVTVEYWTEPVGQQAAKIAETQTDAFYVNDVLGSFDAVYEKLLAVDAIDATRIPEGFEYGVIMNAGQITVAETGTVVRVLYVPMEIPVRVTYWAGKRGANGTHSVAVKDATVPYGLTITAGMSYSILQSWGIISEDEIPALAGYLFDEIVPASFEVTLASEGMNIDLYYINQIPVTISYFTGMPGEVGEMQIAKDEQATIPYGTVISTLEEMVMYINDALAPNPEQYILHSVSLLAPVSTMPFTVDRKGISIKLNFVPKPMPVTIYYFTGQPGEEGEAQIAKDEQTKITYGTVISNLEDMTPYINTSLVPDPELYDLHSVSLVDPVSPLPFTVDRDGISIKLNFVPKPEPEDPEVPGGGEEDPEL